MLTHLRIKNFKAWEDTGSMRLAPLTVIFGPNNAGKSSLGHLLLALKQTVLSSDRRRALHLGDDNSLVNLGTYSDCVFNHDLNKDVEFSLGWKLSRALEVKDPVHKRKYSGTDMELNVSFGTGKMDQPEVSCFNYKLENPGKKGLGLDFTFSRSEEGQWALTSRTYDLVRTLGRAWDLDAPEKFYRISDQSRARYQNAQFPLDFALATEKLLANFFYLGPIRDYPKRIYHWSGETPEDVGAKGENVIAALLAAQERKIKRQKKKRYMVFGELIAYWLKELGLISHFSVKPIVEGRNEYEVLVKIRPRDPEVKISDVGFGVSQVLPPLVEAFYCPADSIVWLEQPEIHLHPRVQAVLADVFIDAITARENKKPRNTQLIIESHSEHFLNRLQRRVAEGVVSPEEVAVYFCSHKDGGAGLEELSLNRYGDIENWPEDFFGDEMEELAARTRAAMKLRKAESELAE